MTITNKILLGNSIPLPEEDLDDKKSDMEDQISALHNYWFASILNNIGEYEFKQNYLSSINEIINKCSIEDQREFCNEILKKIVEIYNFEFPDKIDLNSTNDIKVFYDFLEFLEYDYNNFISNVWLSLNINLLTINFKNYVINNNQIINSIEQEIKTIDVNQIIKIFLRTYDKDNILLWFIQSSIKIESFIKMKYLEFKKGENIK